MHQLHQIQLLLRAKYKGTRQTNLAKGFHALSPVLCALFSKAVSRVHLGLNPSWTMALVCSEYLLHTRAERERGIMGGACVMEPVHLWEDRP